MTWLFRECFTCGGAIQIADGESKCFNCGRSLEPTIDASTLPENYLRKGGRVKGDPYDAKRKRQLQKLSGIRTASFPWRGI